MATFLQILATIITLISSAGVSFIFFIGILIGVIAGVLLPLAIKNSLFHIRRKIIETYEYLWARITKPITDRIKYAIDSKKDISQELVKMHLHNATNNKNVKAQYYSGVFYYHGSGVKKSIKDAVHWFHKAAEQGFAAAQFNLGICYDDGKGVDKDKIEAGYWYRKAAEQRCTKAQFNLGLLYWNSKGTVVNKHKARTWFTIAKSSGDKKAEKWLNKKQWKYLLTPDKIKSAEQEAERIFNEIEIRWKKEQSLLADNSSLKNNCHVTGNFP